MLQEVQMLNLQTLTLNFSATMSGLPFLNGDHMHLTTCLLFLLVLVLFTRSIWSILDGLSSTLMASSILIVLLELIPTQSDVFFKKIKLIFEFIRTMIMKFIVPL